MPFSEYCEIDLGFVKGISDNYTLSTDGMESFPAATSFKLIDKKLNIVQNLNQSSNYSFSSSGGDATNRFKLTIGFETGIEQNMDEGRWVVYQQNERIFIKDLHGGTDPFLIEIYDSGGRKIAGQLISESSQCLNVLKESTGIYLYRIYDRKNFYSGKILLND